MISSAPYSLSAYDFDLPPEQIAQFPIEPRDHSRLLILDRARATIEHRRFFELPEYLDERDLLVANNTRVMKARLLGHRLLRQADGSESPGGKIEMLLLEPWSEDRLAPLGVNVGGEEGGFYWEGAFKSTARQIPGLRFAVPKPAGGFLVGELVRGASESSTGTVIARFAEDPLAAGAGELPLPHYISRAGAPGGADESAYQTVYAKETGSAAAPTAGLHFTPRVLEGIAARGAHWTEVTLHVGLGTFRPVKTEDIRAHAMHEERYFIPAEVARTIGEHRAGGGRVLCVGTTSVRTLETVYRPGPSAGQPGIYEAGAGGTSIFLHPGGRTPQAFDRLLTNFHLPRSTLLMLVCAFGGTDLVLRAYREAVREKYRFFSYGDAMLIL